MNRPTDDVLQVIEDLKIIQQYITEDCKFTAAEVYQITILKEIAEAQLNGTSNGR